MILVDLVIVATSFVYVMAYSIHLKRGLQYLFSVLNYASDVQLLASQRRGRDACPAYHELR